MNEASSSAPMRVLVVDDCWDTTDSLTLLLKLWGHEVHVAHDGPAALEQAGAHPPDVVLLDVALGRGMDGYEVARRLRTLPHLQQALLICLTGYGTDADRRQSQEAGFDHHLTKPGDPNQLQRLLAAHTARSGGTGDPLLAPDRGTPLAGAPGLARPEVIEESAERRLRDHPCRALRSLSCAYRAGVLTLRGWLPTYYLKQLAQEAVTPIEGVQWIDNQINVQAPAGGGTGQA